MLVDASSFDATWPGWSAGHGHILVPLDVARRAGGHDLVFPVCGERASDFLLRREQAGVPLSAGEAVTLGVSILRGMGELLRAPDSRGEWWLTDDGRPVLAAGSGARSALDDSRELLAQLARAGDDPRWAMAQEALANEVLRPRRLEEADDELFTLAEAAPLATSSMSPRSSSFREPLGARLAAADRERAGHRVDAGDTPRPLLQRLARHADADLADVLGRATTAVWRRVTQRSSARRARAPWLVAAVIAVVVVAGGVMWPGNEQEPATAKGTATDPPTLAATGSGGDSDEVAETEEVRDTEPIDLAGQADALLTEYSGCHAEPACLEPLLARDDLEVPAGATGLPAGQRSVTLLDDFGDIAVLRVDASDDDGRNGSVQMVVLERQNDQWLLRDVYDAAQQP
jgi:hypothetical protein